MKNFLKQLGSYLLGILVLFLIFYFSFQPGTAESCSTLYINGDYSLKTLRKQCPNLTKELLLKNIDNYFENNNFDIVEEKDRLKSEVNNYF